MPSLFCSTVSSRKAQKDSALTQPMFSLTGLSSPLMEDFAVDVGPKLLKEVRSSVNRYIRQPELIGFGEGALLAGVIKSRDARGARAEDFGSIEGLMATIFSCDGCT